VAWRLFTRVAGLASTLILARLLIPDDFGLVAIATGIIGTIEALSWISVHDALIRHPERSRPLYDTGFTLQVLRATLTAALLAAAADPLATFFADPRLRDVVFLLAAGTVLSGFENIGIADFRRDLRFDLEFRMQAASRLAGVVVTVSGAVILRTYWALVLGLLVTRAIRLVMSYAMSAYRPGWSLRAWRVILGYSAWTWAALVVAQIRERVDVMAIGRSLGPGSVGIYALGVEIGSLTTTELVEPLHRALFSSFAHQQRSEQDQTGLFITAIGSALLVVLPAGVGVSIVADPLVRLALGAAWLEVIPVIQIIGIGCTVTVFHYVTNALLLALGQPRLAFWMSVASTPPRVAAILIGLWYAGLAGAALGMVGSFVCDQVIALAVIPPNRRIAPRRLIAVCWRPVLGCLVMVATLHLAGLAWTTAAGDDVWSLMAGLVEPAIIGAACYGSAVIALWLLVGRPDGAETALWAAARSALGR
jgi:O-antigen/teichoic acid export membrane protein